MIRTKSIYIFILIFAVFLPSMKIQAAYKDSQGEVKLKPGIYQTLDMLEKSQDDMVTEFIEGPSTWVKSGYYSYEFLDSQKKYITIRKIDSEAVQGGKLVIPKEIDGHQVLGIGLWTDWVISADEEHYRVIDRKLDIEELVLPEGLEFLGAASFIWCPGLKRICFPDSLVAIRTQAFYDCEISELELPPGVYVEIEALSGSGIDIGEEDNAIPFERCSPWKITMYSDSLVSFSNSWSVNWGLAELYIRYHEQDSYSLDIPGYIEKLYIDKKLSKFQLEIAYNYNHIPLNYRVTNLIMNGKNTKLVLSKDINEVLPIGALQGLYTVKGAKSIKEAKKYRIPVYWKTAGKAKTVKSKKLASTAENGAYQASWKKIKTTIYKNEYKAKKWKVTKTPTQTIYKVYGKKKKSDSYQLIKTTKKKSIKSEYKYIKAVPVKEWE